MSNMKKAFENGKALIAFITCGDPDMATTAAAIRAAVAGGADMIELGIPFSDPTAEGPVIQGANIRALAGGVTTDRVFEFIEGLRADVQVPIIFRTYANVVFSYGAERFMAECHRVGVSGLLLPELPYEEKEEFAPACAKYGIELISTIAPAQAERIAMIAGEAGGFVDITSSLGAETTRSAIVTGMADMAAIARRNSSLPCVADYGITTPEQAAAAAEYADGAIVDEPIALLMEQHGADASAYIGEYVRRMKAALNG